MCPAITVEGRLAGLRGGRSARLWRRRSCQVTAAETNQKNFRGQFSVASSVGDRSKKANTRKTKFFDFLNLGQYKQHPEATLKLFEVLPQKGSCFCSSHKK